MSQRTKTFFGSAGLTVGMYSAPPPPGPMMTQSESRGAAAGDEGPGGAPPSAAYEAHARRRTTARACHPSAQLAILSIAQTPLQTLELAVAAGQRA